MLFNFSFYHFAVDYPGYSEGRDIYLERRSNRRKPRPEASFPGDRRGNEIRRTIGLIWPDPSAESGVFLSRRLPDGQNPRAITRGIRRFPWKCNYANWLGTLVFPSKEIRHGRISSGEIIPLRLQTLHLCLCETCDATFSKSSSLFASANFSNLRRLTLDIFLR